MKSHVCVLNRLNKANIKVNYEKCKFFVQSLAYLGHIVTDKGLLPSPEKNFNNSSSKTSDKCFRAKSFFGFNKLLWKVCSASGFKTELPL